MVYGLKAIWNTGSEHRAAMWLPFSGYSPNFWKGTFLKPTLKLSVSLPHCVLKVTYPLYSSIENWHIPPIAVFKPDTVAPVV